MRDLTNTNDIELHGTNMEHQGLTVQNPRTVFIYVIKDGEFLKIGLANNIEKRRKSLQTGNPRKLTVVKFFEIPRGHALSVETKVHHSLRVFHVQGEWFSCQLETAMETIERTLCKVISTERIMYVPYIVGDKLSKGRFGSCELWNGEAN